MLDALITAAFGIVLCRVALSGFFEEWWLNIFFLLFGAACVLAGILILISV
jgi:hypothetical protein